MLVGLLPGILGAPCSLSLPLLIPARMLQCGVETPQALVPAEPMVGSRAGIHPCPGREGTGPVLAQPANSSLFLRWLHVCFQIPEAFVTPHRWAPSLPLLPSSPCLTRLVCRVGHQAKPLSPAAPLARARALSWLAGEPQILMGDEIGNSGALPSPSA